MPRILLGRLVDVVHPGPGGSTTVRAPARERWLLWQGPTFPGWGRLAAVELGRELGPADDESTAAVRAWIWHKRADAARFAVVEPNNRKAARRIGAVLDITYEVRKGRQAAEWEHPFTLRPTLAIDPAGEWYLSGRVEVSERGILS